MQDLFQSIFTASKRKVLAIGKNYLAHAREMGASDVPATPVVFQKPLSSIIDNTSQIVLPPHQEIHHESKL
jgi:2-keto-4-pentenoate hydratase/2-oxohepta-3-ene-1,7-dioic acid hydratase in catechol pathway